MKKTIAIVISLILAFSISACNNEDDIISPETAGAAMYSGLLDQLYTVIASGETMSSELEGAFALYDGAFGFKYISRLYLVLKAHIIQTGEQGSNFFSLCQVLKQNTGRLA